LSKYLFKKLASVYEASKNLTKLFQDEITSEFFCPKCRKMIVSRIDPPSFINLPNYMILCLKNQRDSSFNYSLCSVNLENTTYDLFGFIVHLVCIFQHYFLINFKGNTTMGALLFNNPSLGEMV